MTGFIVESALLTHGLVSTDNDRILSVWEPGWLIGWLDRGHPVTGDAEEFLSFRMRADEAVRVGYAGFDEACRNGVTGALTASGTIRLCEKLGVPLAVSCGIGGLMHGQDISRSNDLSALAHTEVSLAATAFKDMFDQYYTVRTAMDNGIRVYSGVRAWHPGYIFDCHGKAGAEEAAPDHSDRFQKGTLYLYPIEKNKMIRDAGLLKAAVEYGEEEAKRGRPFHPAVNAKIDELTQGLSSELQLQALVSNIRRADVFS